MTDRKPYYPRFSVTASYQETLNGSLCNWIILGHQNFDFYPFKRQFHKMVKHTQTIRRKIADEFLSVFDHFVGQMLKGLTRYVQVAAKVTVTKNQCKNVTLVAISFQDNIKFVGHDINVTGVWENNITGMGVTVSVIDDGKKGFCKFY